MLKLFPSIDGEKSNPLYDKACIYADTYLTRFNNFIEKLWNHHTIQKLIDPNLPQETIVIGQINGFKFITEIISKNIFCKVFYSKSLIPPVKIVSSENICELEISLKLPTEKGKYYYYY